MDKKCSGRRQCVVDVTEPTFGDVRPCNDELKSHLTAEYLCLPGGCGVVWCSVVWCNLVCWFCE